MHRHFCTLFDRNYAAKGLALNDSLMRHSSEPFTLHILTLDEETFWLLDELNLENVKLIPHESFEWAMKLGEIKQARTWKEWCWSCASSLMEFMLTFPSIDEITYLDADIFFFADPKLIFDEMANRSIGITPHRFTINTPAHVLGNGRFNVGIVVARNSEIGRKCISRWAEQVREWCHEEADLEHACGDQKYLDEWPELYGNAVRILEHPGINLGPWAIGNYNISMFGSSYTGRQDVLVNEYTLIAYHFHEYKDPEHLTNWRLRFVDIALIYKPYIAAWSEAVLRIEGAETAIQQRREKQQLQAERA